MPAGAGAALDELVARARALADAGPRQLLGIAGAPGAGKSTLAERIVAAVGPAARLVPMDGFHLAQAELVRLGRADRKGASDTFDANGFVSLLRRLRRLEPTVGLRAGVPPGPGGAGGRGDRGAAVGPAGGDRGQLPAAAGRPVGRGAARCCTRRGSSISTPGCGCAG